MAALGARHVDVKRLRLLLRDPRARREEQAVVLEGPRVVDDALRRGVVLDALYLGLGADRAFRPLVEQAGAAGVRVATLKAGVLERVGTTRTPQPVLAVGRWSGPVATATLVGARPVLVAVDVADPGNLGALLRSAEASGCAGVVCCGDTVDVRNPKVVRASAGAVFGVPLVEADDPVQVLEELRAQNRVRYAAAASGGTRYHEVALDVPVALVVGNEARGISPAVRDRVEGALTIPMAGATESLNVAVAAGVLLFEAARQRRAR